MLKSLSEQGLDLSIFCLSYRLSAGPRRLHHINFQKWVKALQTYKMSKRSWNSWNGLNFKTCHNDKAAVVEWLLVAVSEVPETDGWWLFQIVTGFCWYLLNCANISRIVPISGEVFSVPSPILPPPDSAKFNTGFLQDAWRGQSGSLWTWFSEIQPPQSWLIWIWFCKIFCVLWTC